MDKYNVPKWTTLLEAEVYSSPALNLRCTRLFIGDEAGVFRSLDPQTGRVLSSFQTGGAIRGTAALGQELAAGTHLYIASTDGKLYCLDQNDVSVMKWNLNIGHSAGFYLHSSPVIGTNGHVYVGSGDHSLYAVDPAGSGSILWSFPTSDRVVGSPALGTNNRVFFGSQDGWFHALNPAAPAASRLKWKAQLGGQIKSSPVIASTGKLYIGCDDNKVHAFDAYAEAGGAAVTPLHATVFLAGQMCSGLAISSNGVVYAASWDAGRLYAFSKNLAIHWEFSSILCTTIGSMVAAPAIGPDGSLYIGDIAGQVFNFPVGSPLMASVWPAFQRDMWRSGNGRLNSWPRDPGATIQELTPYYSGTYSAAFEINRSGVVAGQADGYPAYPMNWGYAWNAAFRPAGAAQ